MSTKSAVFVQGKVSHVRSTSKTTGTIHDGDGDIETTQVTTFRIGNSAYSLPGAEGFADGDAITMVGKNEKGRFFCTAWRNDTTGVIQGQDDSDRGTTVLFAASALAFGLFCFGGALLAAIDESSPVLLVVGAVPGWLSISVARSLWRRVEETKSHLEALRQHPPHRGE